MYQVMIVDDELSVLEGIAYTIPWHTLEVDAVHQALSADEALRLLDRHHVDIVITDIRMPGMDGIELIREIRRRWSGIRCIILSGHGEFDYARAALRAETTDYLLKPIQADDLVDAVRTVQRKLREEWEQVSLYRETASVLREHSPLLRSNLLGGLLQGRSMPGEKLERKMALLDIPFNGSNDAALLMVRLEDEFFDYGSDHFHLLEYAVCNITEEIFGKHFDTWCHIDGHGYLVFAIKPKDGGGLRPRTPEASGGTGNPKLIERLAAQLQQSVQTYLKGSISIMVSRWGRFPGELHRLYEEAIVSFRRRIGNSSGFFYSAGDEADDVDTQSLDELYRLPTLMHLLEAGVWEQAEAKLNAIIADLAERFAESREHLAEAYFVIYASFSHLVHRNGKYLSDLLPAEAIPADAVAPLRSVNRLRGWACRTLAALKSEAEANMSSANRDVVGAIQRYIETHLAGDVSLQAIADHIHFHPVYLSKLYRQETGETLSDYIHRARMEKAAYLLKHSELKNYEIAGQIGYEHTYFNRVFKKHFGMTPQEYREG